jgi:hypothetical protein
MYPVEGQTTRDSSSCKIPVKNASEMVIFHTPKARRGGKSIVGGGAHDAPVVKPSDFS